MEEETSDCEDISYTSQSGISVLLVLAVNTLLPTIDCIHVTILTVMTTRNADAHVKLNYNNSIPVLQLRCVPQLSPFQPLEVSIGTHSLVANSMYLHQARPSDPKH